MTAPEVTEGEVAKVAEVKSPEMDVVPDTKRQKTVDENGEEQVEYKHEEEVEGDDDDDDEQNTGDNDSADDDNKETAASVAKEVDSSNIIPRYYCVGV